MSSYPENMHISIDSQCVAENLYRPVMYIYMLPS
jgi:hypothetical protein